MFNLGCESKCCCLKKNKIRHCSGRIGDRHIILLRSIIVIKVTVEHITRGIGLACRYPLRFGERGVGHSKGLGNSGQQYFPIRLPGELLYQDPGNNKVWIAVNRAVARLKHGGMSLDRWQKLLRTEIMIRISFELRYLILWRIRRNFICTQTWRIPGIFAAVNDFRLPNNSWDKNNLENTTRWTSFRNKYAGVTSGQRVDIEMLKSITGYPGDNSSGKMTEGAIFTSEMQQLSDSTYPIPALVAGASLPGFSKAYTTMQSVIMDMKTMELWIHFVPPTYFGEKPPLRPTYQKIPNPIYWKIWKRPCLNI